MAIIINIYGMLAKRKMSVTELADKVGIMMTNISASKKWQSKSNSANTLDSMICKALECQPGMPRAVFAKLGT